MTRRRRLLIGLAVLALGGVLALPSVHWRLVGWWQGEPFYRGMPASYWADGTSDHRYPPVWLYRRDVRHKSLFSDSLSRVKRFLGVGNRFEPVGVALEDFDPDPDAVPVLIYLLYRSEPDVRTWAADALGWMGRVAKPAAPDLRRLLGDPAPAPASFDAHGTTVADHAALALQRINPEPLIPSRQGMQGGFSHLNGPTVPKEAAGRP